MSKCLDLIGKKFGKLTAIKRVENDRWGRTRWLCKCDCRNETVVCGSHLKGGDTKSCGCLVTKHGQARRGKITEIYQSWADMIQRCTNSNHKRWKDYGGRGITVCEEWRKFSNFLKDMKKKWEPGLTIERIDKNGNYCSGNCKWATWKDQARNKRNNHLIICFGKTQCIATWSEETGIPARTIQWRINHGWLPERALTEPVRKYKEKKGTK